MTFEYLKYRSRMLKAAERLVRGITKCKRIRVIYTRTFVSRTCLCTFRSGGRVRIVKSSGDAQCFDHLITACISSLSGRFSLAELGSHAAIAFGLSLLIYTVIHYLFEGVVSRSVLHVITAFLTALPYIFFSIEAFSSRFQLRSSKFSEGIRMLRNSDNLCKEIYDLFADFLALVESRRENQRIECEQLLKELREKHEMLLSLVERGGLRT